MRPVLAATSLFWWSFVCVLGAAEPPAAVARKALDALYTRQADALRPLVHPEFVARIRNAELLRKHFAARAAIGQKLANVGDSAAADDAFSSDAAGRLTDDQIVSLLFTLLDQQHPRNPRFYYVHLVNQSAITSELAIVVFDTTRKNAVDPLDVFSTQNEVFLKRVDDEWRLLWAPAIQRYVEPLWDPRKELVAHVEVTAGPQTRVSMTGVHIPPIFRKTSLLLPPGDYEIKGTRRGYRDVGWLVHVSEDLQPIALTVMCTEPEKTEAGPIH
jgi:hypothetical protein